MNTQDISLTAFNEIRDILLSTGEASDPPNSMLLSQLGSLWRYRAELGGTVKYWIENTLSGKSIQKKHCLVLHLNTAPGKQFLEWVDLDAMMPDTSKDLWRPFDSFDTFFQDRSRMNAITEGQTRLWGEIQKSSNCPSVEVFQKAYCKATRLTLRISNAPNTTYSKDFICHSMWNAMSEYHRNESQTKLFVFKYSAVNQYFLLLSATILRPGNLGLAPRGGFEAAARAFNASKVNLGQFVLRIQFAGEKTDNISCFKTQILFPVRCDSSRRRCEALYQRVEAFERCPTNTASAHQLVLAVASGGHHAWRPITRSCVTRASDPHH